MVIPRELELDGRSRSASGRVIKYCEPVGNHARMTELLLHRAATDRAGRAAARDEPLHRRPRHRPERQLRRRGEARSRAHPRARPIYAEVLNAYMEEEPLDREMGRSMRRSRMWSSCRSSSRTGLHSYEDIPVLLGIATASRGAASVKAARSFAEIRIGCAGARLYYASAIGTEPLFADVILDQVAAFDAAHRETFADCSRS